MTAAGEGWADRVVPDDEASLVAAAQAGDGRALDELVAAYLPLVYTVVGRALGGLADVDDVVQETMLCVLRDLRTLRNPDSFRPWLVTIATRQVSTYLRRRDALQRTAALDDVVDTEDADSEGFVLLRIELARQRRQVVRAASWLDPDDRTLLRLWWLETAGWLCRTDLAAALGVSAAHAGVRVQRMRIQLELSRSLVAALEARPRCARLDAASTDWDGVPSPLWRKRIARHTRSCPACRRAADGLVPPERLLAGLALLSGPMAVSVAAHGESGLAVTVASAFAVVASRSGAGGPMNGDAGAKSRLLGWLARMTGARPVATAVTAGTPAAGGFRTDRTFGPGPGSAGPVPVPGSPPPESTSHRVDLARGSITENARNRNVCGIRFSADPPTVPKKCYRQASSNVAPID